MNSKKRGISELEHMKNCEARDWERRFREKASIHGYNKAFAWWQGVLRDLERIRGESATLDLRQRMNKLKDKK